MNGSQGGLQLQEVKQQASFLQEPSHSFCPFTRSVASCSCSFTFPAHPPDVNV
jgi:hypothetical protein